MGDRQLGHLSSNICPMAIYSTFKYLSHIFITKLWSVHHSSASIQPEPKRGSTFDKLQKVKHIAIDKTAELKDLLSNNDTESDILNCCWYSCLDTMHIAIY